MSTKQVAIITGASSGLGEGLAIALAGRGIRVGLLARRLDRLKNLEERINNSGGEAFAVACDVSQEDDVKAAHREIASRFGEVDLLIVNAGIALNMGRDILNPSMLEQIYRVNLFGPIYSIQEVLPGMLQRRKGHIVALSSLASFRGYPKLQGYSGSKSALNRELECLRNRVYKKGVHVTTICPGFIRTELTEKMPVNQPFLMELDPAVKMILSAIDKKKRRFLFPFPMSLMTWWMSVLPDRIFDIIVRRMGGLL